MDEKPILSAKDLELKFTLRGKVMTALRGISLDVYKGESLAIVGESGSGKSVFTKALWASPTPTAPSPAASFGTRTRTCSR